MKRFSQEVSSAAGITLLAGLVCSVVLATERFDLQVRNDFFAGFAGNAEALDRGMKNCEAILRDNPNHAQAKVWHGGGLLFQAGTHFSKGDVQTGSRLFDAAVKQMDEAVASEPGSLAVRIPRGSAYLAATPFMPPAVAKPLLERALEDYEKTYAIQQPYFDKLSSHARGELLVGLADGYRRFGNADRARHFFQKLAQMGPQSGHLVEAEEYLRTGTLAKAVRCSGCHVE